MHDFTFLMSECFLSLAWIIVFSFVGLPLLDTFIFVGFRCFAVVFFSLPAFSGFSLPLMCFRFSIVFMFVAPSGVGSPVCTSWESDKLTSGWHLSGPYSQCI